MRQCHGGMSASLAADAVAGPCPGLAVTTPLRTMPVFSSAQSARRAPGTYAGLGSPDLIVTAGGGIMAHPDGPAAGVAGLREAWEAAMSGIPLADYARDHQALARALAARAA